MTGLVSCISEVQVENGQSKGSAVPWLDDQTELHSSCKKIQSTN